MKQWKRDMLAEDMNKYLDEYLLFCDLCNSRHIKEDDKIIELWSTWIVWESLGDV